MTNISFSVNINGESIAINGKSELSFTDSMLFANSIIYDLFGGGSEPILYLKDFVIKKNVIQYYTDYKLPEDINECFDIVYNSNLYNEVVGKIRFDSKQHNTLMEGIYEQIEYEKIKSVHSTSLDELFKAIKQFIDKIDEKIDISKIGNILEKLQKVEKIDEKVLAEAVLSMQKPRKTKAKTGK